MNIDENGTSYAEMQAVPFSHADSRVPGDHGLVGDNYGQVGGTVAYQFPSFLCSSFEFRVCLFIRTVRNSSIILSFKVLKPKKDGL